MISFVKYGSDHEFSTHSGRFIKDGIHIINLCVEANGKRIYRNKEGLEILFGILRELSDFMHEEGVEDNNYIDIIKELMIDGLIRSIKSEDKYGLKIWKITDCFGELIFKLIPIDSYRNPRRYEYCVFYDEFNKDWMDNLIEIKEGEKISPFELLYKSGLSNKEKYELIRSVDSVKVEGSNIYYTYDRDTPLLILNEINGFYTVIDKRVDFERFLENRLKPTYDDYGCYNPSWDY